MNQLNEEKIKEALAFDEERRKLSQPMQILDDGRIVPILKELSDDEIYEIWEQFNGEIKNFALAILKKASEK